MDKNFSDWQELARFGAPRRDAILPWLPPLGAHAFFAVFVAFFKLAESSTPASGHAGAVSFSAIWAILCVVWVSAAFGQRKDFRDARERAREERLDELRKASIHFGVELSCSLEK